MSVDETDKKLEKRTVFEIEKRKRIKHSNWLFI
jgi:hypothetical protein